MRLPNGLLKALSEEADKTGSTIAGTARSIIARGLEKYDYSTEYEQDSGRGGLNFTASEEIREMSDQAALMEGTSVNALYVKMIADALGELPCVVKEISTEE